MRLSINAKLNPYFQFSHLRNKKKLALCFSSKSTNSSNLCFQKYPSKLISKQKHIPKIDPTRFIKGTELSGQVFFHSTSIEKLSKIMDQGVKFPLYFSYDIATLKAYAPDEEMGVIIKFGSTEKVGIASNIFSHLYVPQEHISKLRVIEAYPAHINEEELIQLSNKMLKGKSDTRKEHLRFATLNAGFYLSLATVSSLISFFSSD